MTDEIQAAATEKTPEQLRAEQADLEAKAAADAQAQAEREQAEAAQAESDAKAKRDAEEAAAQAERDRIEREAADKAENDRRVAAAQAEQDARDAADNHLADPPRERPATERLRTFEDEHVGAGAVRINGRIERGSGSPFAALSDESKRQYAALEKLVAAEQKLADAHTALIQAETDHEAALAAAESKPDAE